MERQIVETIALRPDGTSFEADGESYRYALAAGRLARRLPPQRARDLGAGLISVRMHDPSSRVGSLPAQFEIAPRLQIELSTCGRQLTDPRGTLFDKDLDCFRVSKGGARGQRKDYETPDHPEKDDPPAQTQRTMPPTRS